ncbi:Transmembrane protein [Hirschfeldia incana]|nr:Transmembrane protein [Hirschfeldia incana]
MEALWKLEDKLKLTTKEAVVILVGTAAAVTLLCTAVAFINRNTRGKQVAHAEWASETSSVWSGTMNETRNCKWSKVKRRLMGSFCWSSAAKWMEMETRPTTRTLLEVKERSLNAVDPVWQRPILMGEKCELPRFSGLILYDERGDPIQHSPSQEEVKHIPLVRTTLRDLL